MNSENVFFYAILSVIGMVGGCISCMVLKYFNQKALGMQTILDQMIKDRIYLVMSIWATDIMVIIHIEFMTSLNPYIALTLSFLNRVYLIASIWQFSAILVIRYLLVFYQNLMNHFDESLVKRVARSFVVLISIIFILISDLESTAIYPLLIGKVPKPGINKLFIVAAILCLIIMIVTQYKIEMFRKSVDLRSQLHQRKQNLQKYTIWGSFTKVELISKPTPTHIFKQFPAKI